MSPYKQHSLAAPLKSGYLSYTLNHAFDQASRAWLPQIPPLMGVPGVTPYPPIYFEAGGAARQGIMMVDATKYPVALKGERDQVFAGTGVKTINLWIAWPQYQNRMVTINNVSSMTRGQLGQTISRLFGETMKSIEGFRPNHKPDYPIGADGLRHENMILVGLHHIEGDHWMAAVAYQL